MFSDIIIIVVGFIHVFYKSYYEKDNLIYILKKIYIERGHILRTNKKRYILNEE